MIRARYWYYAELRRRRRRRLAILIIALLTLTVWAAARQGHTPDNRPRPPAGHATSAPLSGKDITWASYSGIELPVSARNGPDYMENGLARGFTDTPAGAVVAAVNIAVRTAAQWGPAIYEPTIRAQVTGPDTAALLASDASQWAALQAAAPGQPASPAYVTVAAYRIVSWTTAAATVDIVTEAPGASGSQLAIAATRIQLTWMASDWRLIAPPGGDWAATATPMASLSGYTPFPQPR